MKKIPQAIGPYTTHRKSGNLMFVSGQLPINPNEGKIVATTIEEQTKQSLENIESILESEGLNFSNILKTTVFLSDINNFSAMNEIYGTKFQAPFPARSAFEVSALPMGALVEIEVIAELKK